MRYTETNTRIHKQCYSDAPCAQTHIVGNFIVVFRLIPLCIFEPTEGKLYINISQSQRPFALYTAKAVITKALQMFN